MITYIKKSASVQLNLPKEKIAGNQEFHSIIYDVYFDLFLYDEVENVEQKIQHFESCVTLLKVTDETEYRIQKDERVQDHRIRFY